MVGAASLNSTQLAVDSVLGQVNTTTVPEPEKPSLSAPNEEEVPERINKTEGNGAAGVKKAEAAALVWSKNALWAIYAWIWVCFFMLAFYSSIGTNVLVNAYANFKTAPEISTAAILATVVGGVVKLPIAKIVNIWASKSGICLAFSSTPFIYTAFTGPLAAQSFLNMTTWRFSRTPLSGNTNMRYTRYNGHGVAMPFSKLTKLDIVNQYGLSARDLRTLDVPSDGFPHILIRESTLLIHMFNLRLLVQADQMLVFHLAETSTQEPDTISRVFLRDLKSKLRGDPGLGVSVGLPYELRILEAALAAVTSTLEAEYVLTKDQVMKTLGMVDKEEGEIHSNLRTLLELVRKLAATEKRARQVRSAVQDVLNTDEDMAAMYLSDKQAGKPHQVEDHQDVEYLLEAYYKASDAVVQEATSLMGTIQQTEESIQSILDVRRNQIMVLEAKIEILMLGMAVATLVAGWYGMNVVNYFEESGTAFAVLVSSSLVAIAFLSRYGFRQLRRIQKMHL
ncbi:Mg2 transporter protein CorA family protein [Aspergillus oryzae]|uniref:Magnesium transporter n=1 Tax=Aspergillus oryzae TaxID=5062 RepID=A0A1S9DBQ9_ASPOZ|nr:uncharacterized protein G4B84_010295 [Aspergillus flavus NRRL3357]OOO06537.1 Mg2 transporter protein CorA family protein [Aspergillus oryzae]QMW34804.1 hypothetical protein G4B84_010295 [Aspergillus flavus NRRL3357]